MSKNLELKKQVVSDIVKKFQDAQSVMIVNYNGLTVEQVTGLRAQFRAAGVEYVVLKNTLVRRALQELNMASMTLRDSKTSAPVVIRMGIVSGTLGGLVARQIADYVQQNERVRFRLTESSAEELMDLVRQEKLDVAIVDTTNRDRSLHFRKLCQRDFSVALPLDHPLSGSEFLLPQHISHEPQVVFNYDIENSFGQWASGMPAEERIVCSVNTAQSALDLVAANVGICVLSNSCIQPREDVRFLPLHNWHQALYMCILYDKWLEPPIWNFVEILVKAIRSKESTRMG